MARPGGVIWLTTYCGAEAECLRLGGWPSLVASLGWRVGFKPGRQGRGLVLIVLEGRAGTAQVVGLGALRGRGLVL